MHVSHGYDRRHRKPYRPVVWIAAAVAAVLCLAALAGCASSIFDVGSHRQDLPLLTDDALACGHCVIVIAKGAPVIDPQLMFVLCKEPSRWVIDRKTDLPVETACHVLPAITANQASSFQLGTLGALVNSLSLSVPVTPAP